MPEPNLIYLQFLLLVTCSLFGNAVKYPNEIEETPTVICEKDQIVVKVS